MKSIVTGTPDLGWDDTLKFLTIPLILFISQTISSKVLQPPKDPNKVLSDQELTTQGIINNVPFIVAFFSLNVPAGLGVYWIINNVFTTLITLVVKSGLKDEAMPVEVEKMMAAIESDTMAGGGAGGAVKTKMSGAQQELGRQNMSSRMSEEDKERMERFEAMQQKGGFGAGAAPATEEMPIVDVTPEEGTASTATTAEDPKGPLGKTLKFINDNAAKIEVCYESRVFSFFCI